MKLFKNVFLLVAIAILSSCASSYVSVEPESLYYNSNDNNNGVSLQYRYNLMNKRYSKKERKKGIKIVAVKITNNTDQKIVFGRDFSLAYANGFNVHVMDQNVVYRSMRQNSASYLWYLLLTPLKFYKKSDDGSISTTSVGYGLGPGLAGINMIRANSANEKLKKELYDFDLIGTTIKSGETKVGLIGIQSDNFDSIKIRMHKSGNSIVRY